MALLLRLAHWVDSEGMEHWLEVRPEIAALLAATEPRLKERLLRKPGALDRIADRDGDFGNVWEGPRLRFRWLVGSSRTWSGEPVIVVEGVPYCTMCWGMWLPTWSYCIGCDRSGADRPVEPSERPRHQPGDGDLAGGLGPARPGTMPSPPRKTPTGKAPVGWRLDPRR